MLRYLVRRAISSVAVLVISVLLVFLAIRILPGDPVLAKLGAATEVTPEALALMRKEAGLDRPLLSQLWTWVTNALQGDLGTSYFSQFKVTELVVHRLPVTFELTFFIILFAVIFSLILRHFLFANPVALLIALLATSPLLVCQSQDLSLELY